MKISSSDLLLAEVSVCVRVIKEHYVNFISKIKIKEKKK